MIAYVLDNEDLSIRDVLEFESYSFADDIEFANKSSITTIKKPNIDNDDFVLCKDGNKVIFLGLCENYSSSEGSAYTISLLQKENFFDRDIFKGDTSKISIVGIEDFIKDEITANWIDSGDELLDKTYLEVTAQTHTPVAIDIEDEVYNLKDFLGEVKEYYKIFLDYEIVNGTLQITIRHDNASSLPIDVLISDVSDYTETYNVDVLAKLNVKWKKNDGKAGEEYDTQAYLTATGISAVNPQITFDGNTDTVVASFALNSLTAQTIFGDSTFGCSYASGIKLAYVVAGVAKTITASVSVGDVVDVQMGVNGQYLYVNGELKGSDTNIPDTHSFALTALSGFTGRYYSMSFEMPNAAQNKSVKMLPSQRLSDSAYGFYISNELFLIPTGTLTGSMFGEVRNKQYFLKDDLTITEDIDDPDRASGIIQSVYIAKDSATAMLQDVLNQFTKNKFEHKITFNLWNESKAYPVANYYVGRGASIKTKTGIKTSLITGMSWSSESNFTGFSFGNLKISLIDKIREMK